MRSIKFTVTFAFLLVLPIQLFAQSKTADADGRPIFIDAKKPAVYLEFVKTGTCNNGNYFLDIRVGPCEKKSELDIQFDAAWIRFVNNTRWAILVDVQKMAVPPVVDGYQLANKSLVTGAKDGAEIDVIYDIESETGCDFGVDVPKGEPCKRRETQVPNFYRRGFSGSVVIPSGQSIVFPVNRDHLIKYLTVYVLFNYEWELTSDGMAPHRYDSQHRVYFNWYNLEQGIKAKIVETVQKPKGKKE